MTIPADDQPEGAPVAPAEPATSEPPAADSAPVTETAESPLARDASGPAASAPLLLHYAAISDVGRVRKDNQDSGYAGPWLLTVCDGVGGAARGDVASSTAIASLRALDDAPTTPDGSDLLRRVTDALHSAHESIGHLVDQDPALNGTSTTATVALFDGRRAAIGHVGDSRAYLFREGELSQLTTDHTLVQSLIDEGRITEAEARVHPHRNLILKALDGIHEAEPDVYVIELVPGDRLFLCSDGASGVLDDGRLADILSMGTPDFAAVELVRASLEAGSSDNVTCLVADVLDVESAAALDVAELEPQLVGAAAELRRRLPRALFRGHRSGDTGEMEPIDAEIPDDIGFAIPSDPIIDLDPEAARYAPRAPQRYAWARRLLVLVVVVGVVWLAAAGAWSWIQQQYYVGSYDGRVAIFRGVDASLPGVDLSEPVVVTDVTLEELSDVDRSAVSNAIAVDDLADARDKVEALAANRQPTTTEDTD
ncbi:PP2C family serine/threonine-protein phosphatase [Nocardioides sp. R-C-SC26]|uniref:PP2C family protein-serine/threonine phosphatase n=1 Tax=Nocardioides sp. R-C-SC26 TaxID=2870414 RepID=UPI001E395F90|nr:protein phosphatase 2C domain-containing protein [Nocardioides sp. R-C-SC26]